MEFDEQRTRKLTIKKLNNTLFELETKSEKHSFFRFAVGSKAIKKNYFYYEVKIMRGGGCYDSVGYKIKKS
jgi:hypothetical protein